MANKKGATRKRKILVEIEPPKVDDQPIRTSSPSLPISISDIRGFSFMDPFLLSRRFPSEKQFVFSSSKSAWIHVCSWT